MRRTPLMKVRFAGKSQNLIDADYDIKEQEKIYDDTLVDVFNNTRWYLDNLDFMRSYKVSWKTYRGKIPTIPYRFTKKEVEKQ